MELGTVLKAFLSGAGVDTTDEYGQKPVSSNCNYNP
jgi:hypothetical protein